MVRLGKASRALGAQGEKLAARYLERLGLEIVQRNWRCSHGELDLVAFDREKDTLVFVEVKTRSGLGFGAPLEAITYAKARRLYQLARLWLAANDCRASRIRIDAVGVLFGESGVQISHVKAVSA